MSQHTEAGTRLDPGDVFSIRPECVPFLKGRPVKAPSVDAQSEATETESTDTVEETKKEAEAAAPMTFHIPDYAAPHLYVPAYIEPDYASCSAAYVRHPFARPGYSEIPSPYAADGEVMQLAWEHYSGQPIRPKQGRIASGVKRYLGLGMRDEPRTKLESLNQIAEAVEETKGQ